MWGPIFFVGGLLGPVQIHHILHAPLSLLFEPTRNFDFLGWLVWCVGECKVFKGERVGSGLIFIYNIGFNGIPAAYRTVIS